MPGGSNFRSTIAKCILRLKNQTVKTNFILITFNRLKCTSFLSCYSFEKGKLDQRRTFHRTTKVDGCAKVPCQRSCDAADTLKISSRYKIEKTRGIGDAHLLKHVLKRSFFLDEPTIAMLGLHGGECHGELINVMMEGVNFEQSLIAKDVLSDCIVGFALVGEYNQESLDSDLNRWLKKMQDARNRKLLEIWKAISKKFDYNGVCGGRCLELYYLGVLPEARGQGLAKKLVASSINVARLCKYNIMQVVCTSSRSACICQSLKMKHHKTVNYDTLFYADGRRIMCDSPPPPDHKVEIFFQELNCCK